MNSSNPNYLSSASSREVAWGLAGAEVDLNFCTTAVARDLADLSAQFSRNHPNLTGVAAGLLICSGFELASGSTNIALAQNGKLDLGPIDPDQWSAILESAERDFLVPTILGLVGAGHAILRVRQRLSPIANDLSEVKRDLQEVSSLKTARDWHESYVMATLGKMLAAQGLAVDDVREEQLAQMREMLLGGNRPTEQQLKTRLELSKLVENSMRGRDSKLADLKQQQVRIARGYQKEFWRGALTVSSETAQHVGFGFIGIASLRYLFPSMLADLDQARSAAEFGDISGSVRALALEAQLLSFVATGSYVAAKVFSVPDRDKRDPWWKQALSFAGDTLTALNFGVGLNGQGNIEDEEQIDEELEPAESVSEEPKRDGFLARIFGGSRGSNGSDGTGSNGKKDSKKEQPVVDTKMARLGYAPRTRK